MVMHIGGPFDFDGSTNIFLCIYLPSSCPPKLSSLEIERRPYHNGVASGFRPLFPKNGGTHRGAAMKATKQILNVSYFFLRINYR